jgi:hypothetical protein
LLNFTICYMQVSKKTEGKVKKLTFKFDGLVKSPVARHSGEG